MINSLIASSKNLGIRIEMPEIIDFRARTVVDFMEQLKRQDFNNGKCLALFILNRYSKAYYSDIKQFLYTELE